MFGLFSKSRQFPKLTPADKMIIAALDRETEAHSRAFSFYMRAQHGDAQFHAYAKAEWDLARERKHAAQVAYDAMMERLTAEARASIVAGGR